MADSRSIIARIVFSESARIATLIVLSAAATACRRERPKEEATVSASGAASSPPPSATTQSASAPAGSSTREAEDSADAKVIADAGTDGGPRRRRRKLVNVADSGTPDVTGADERAATQAPTQAAGVDRVGAKGTGTAMGNEQPYGGAAGSAAPVLKKKPLLEDDPWRN